VSSKQTGSTEHVFDPQAELPQQCALHVFASHDTTPGSHTFAPLHSRSHIIVALQSMPAAQLVPVLQSTMHVAPPHTTGLFPHVLLPSHVMSHLFEAVHVTPAAHDVPLKHVTLQSLPLHCTPLFWQAALP
jgi:hypothetical protein